MDLDELDDDFSDLSDDELEEALTLAVANEHRAELYEALLAERARRAQS